MRQSSDNRAEAASHHDAEIAVEESKKVEASTFLGFFRREGEISSTTSTGDNFASITMDIWSHEIPVAAISNFPASAWCYSDLTAF